MTGVNARAERAILSSLFAALEDPARASALSTDAQLLAVARRHRLTPLLSSRCRATLPRDLAEPCRRDQVITTARSLALVAAAEECLAAFARAGVDVVVLKGLAYESTLYGGLGSRPTSDIDLLVRERDRRAAFEVLDAMGFEPRAAAPGFDDPDYHEVAWRRAPVEIDLHMALAPYVRCRIDYDDVWRDVREISLGAARARVLSPDHAAVFHALHMAIDHFDVPALYLVDLARLLPSAADAERADAVARAWRCHRPFVTARALAAAFQPAWAAGQPPVPEERRAAEVVAGFGGLAPLPRRAQLRRKLSHFDAPSDLLRYTVVQGRRKLRELVEQNVLKRSARARLGLERR